MEGWEDGLEGGWEGGRREEGVGGRGRKGREEPTPTTTLSGLA